MGVPVKQVTPTTRRLLQKYRWPGNVRELENILKRAIVLSPGPTLDRDVIAPFLEGSFEGVDVDELSLEDIIRKKLSVFLTQCQDYELEDLYETIISRVERPLLELVLEKTRWNQIRAARALGINRNTLRKKIQDFKITKPIRRLEG